ncbi:MAG: transketolase [Bacillota bacterium]
MGGISLDDQTRARLLDVARRLRRHVLEMTSLAGSGHPGGSLSAAEILSTLYFHVMRLDPQRPSWPERDRFILSKGHAAPVLYAALAERGFFPVSELSRLRQLGSILQGHPDRKKTPGVEASTGSLGQGLSIAVGMALAGGLDGLDYRVFALLGDGELQEGQNWEAAMSAAHYRLRRLVAIVDYNGLQIDGPITEVMSPEPLADKWRAFGWQVATVDGHDPAQISAAIGRAGAGDSPVAILARTVKGRGVPFMENRVEWHGKAPTPAQLEEALAQLEEVQARG